MRRTPEYPKKPFILKGSQTMKKIFDAVLDAFRKTTYTNFREKEKVNPTTTTIFVSPGLAEKLQQVSASDRAEIARTMARFYN
jgi:hypothetical protein